MIRSDEVYGIFYYRGFRFSTMGFLSVVLLTFGNMLSIKERNFYRMDVT